MRLHDLKEGKANEKKREYDKKPDRGSGLEAVLSVWL